MACPEDSDVCALDPWNVTALGNSLWALDAIGAKKRQTADGSIQRATRFEKRLGLCQCRPCSQRLPLKLRSLPIFNSELPEFGTR